MPDRTAASPEVVLITGASSGIGRATALELAGRGARLVLVARGEESLDDTAGQARAAGAADVLVRPADVTDEDAIRAAVEVAVGRFGRLDAVVHAAQVMAYGTIEEVPREVFETVVETAVHGTAVVARVVLPVFREQGAGHLVIVNSLLGQVAAPLMGSYVAAKWGQLGLIRVLQQETRDVPGRHRLRHPARRGRHPDLRPGGVVGREHGPAPAAGVLGASAGAADRLPPGPTSPAGAGGHLQPADHRRVPAGPGGLRLPGRRR